jgi:hypothetical protein
MRFRVRNEPDGGPAADGSVVTYSRLSTRGRQLAAERQQPAAERQEPFLDAREVPYKDDELRAYDPERAAGSGYDAAVDDLVEPRGGRNRGKRRGGGFGAIVIGALALAAGMVILAYAYGIATRVDAPPAIAGASATAPDSAGTMRTTLPADDAARSVPVTGAAPAAALTPDATPIAPAEPPKPQIRPEQATAEPAAAAQPAGSDGVPMDGDFALPAAAGGARPALVAPVPATVAPPAAKTASAPAADRKPTAVKPADATAVDSKPADSGDDLMANIERILSRDAAKGDAAAQPVSGAAAPAGPAPIVPDQPLAVSDPNQLPPLPDPNAAAAITPPADIGPQAPDRLIPPADIPNVAPTGTGAGQQ